MRTVAWLCWVRERAEHLRLVFQLLIKSNFHSFNSTLLSKALVPPVAEILRLSVKHNFFFPPPLLSPLQLLHLLSIFQNLLISFLLSSSFLISLYFCIYIFFSFILISRWDKQASFGKKRQPSGLRLEASIWKNGLADRKSVV